MKTLLLLRHAKSSWDAPVSSDFDRPLAPRGERDAPRIGKALRDSGLVVDYVVASPAVRAHRTAELVIQAAKIKAPFASDEAIYEAPVAKLLGVVRAIPDEAETALVVGHNPGFEDLVGVLCGRRGSPFRVRVPTAALACVELDAEVWREAEAGGATLQWMLVPRLLD